MSPSATEREITKAYRELASRYHPDKHQDNELKDLAEEKLAKLNSAYEILKDPARRAAYDANRGTGAAVHGPQAYGTQNTVGPFPYFKLVIVLAFAAGVLFAFRFVRSPRVGAIAGAIVALAWFGPRVVRFCKSRRSR